MNDFISEDEFSPLSGNDVDFLVQLSAELANISGEQNLTHYQRSLIEVGKTQILRLTAMTCAGYDLYVMNEKLAKLYRHELNRVTAVAIEHGVPADAVQSGSLYELLGVIAEEFEVNDDLMDVVIETLSGNEN